MVTTATLNASPPVSNSQFMRRLPENVYLKRGHHHGDTAARKALPRLVRGAELTRATFLVFLFLRFSAAVPRCVPPRIALARLAPANAQLASNQYGNPGFMRRLPGFRAFRVNGGHFSTGKFSVCAGQDVSGDCGLAKNPLNVSAFDISPGGGDLGVCRLGKTWYVYPCSPRWTHKRFARVASLFKGVTAKTANRGRFLTPSRCNCVDVRATPARRSRSGAYLVIKVSQ